MPIDFQDCLVRYEQHGVLFEYPDIWELDEQTSDGDFLITVSCSDTCFWTLRIISSCPSATQVVDSCVKAFEEEYDDVEVEKPDSKLAEMPAAARDVTFFCMDLMNNVGLRSVRTSEFTLLAWWQGTHHELAENQPVLDHITRSLRSLQLLD